MIVFRWVMGVFAVLFAIAGIGSFLIYLGSKLDHWLVRARRFRHWIWLAFGLWFNIEIWGSVVHTLVNWNH
jgi:hypothetical protein